MADGRLEQRVVRYLIADTIGEACGRSMSTRPNVTVTTRRGNESVLPLHDSRRSASLERASYWDRASRGNPRGRRSPWPRSAARGAERQAHAKRSGAGEGIRTLDVNLGKVALYH
jgi:hypothetical protein